MSKKAPGVMFYLDLRSTLTLYTDEEKGQLLQASLDYAAVGTIPHFDDRGMRTLWNDMKAKIDRDQAKYIKTITDRQYGAYCKYCKDKSIEPMSKEDWLQITKAEQESSDEDDAHARTSMHKHAQANLENGVHANCIGIGIGSGSESLEEGLSKSEEIEGISNTGGFIPPSLEEVEAYIKEKGYSIDPEYFWNYYGSIGWVQSDGTPLIKWKMECSRWQKSENAADPSGCKSVPDTGGFVPPSFDEVSEYINEKGYTVLPQLFWNFYESMRWKHTDGTPVTDWKMELSEWQEGKGL